MNPGQANPQLEYRQSDIAGQPQQGADSIAVGQQGVGAPAVDENQRIEETVEKHNKILGRLLCVCHSICSTLTSWWLPTALFPCVNGIYRE